MSSASGYRGQNMFRNSVPVFFDMSLESPRRGALPWDNPFMKQMRHTHMTGHEVLTWGSRRVSSSFFFFLWSFFFFSNWLSLRRFWCNSTEFSKIFFDLSIGTRLKNEMKNEKTANPAFFQKNFGTFRKFADYVYFSANSNIICENFAKFRQNFMNIKLKELNLFLGEWNSIFHSPKFDAYFLLKY